MDCSVIALEGLGISPKMGRVGNQLILAELLGIIKSQIVISLKRSPFIVPPPTWKKSIIGSGKATKDQVRDKLIEDGYQFDKQDLYDAVNEDAKKHIEATQLLHDMIMKPGGFRKVWDANQIYWTFMVHPELVQKYFERVDGGEERARRRPEVAAAQASPDPTPPGRKRPS